MRITADWTAFGKYHNIFKSNIGNCLKKHIYKSYKIPAMTYGVETWRLTNQAQKQLETTYTKMDRIMWNISYWDRKINI